MIIGDKPTTVVELPPYLRTPLCREINRGLMVHWINQDLTVRAAHDVRHSIVFYDADGDFVFAMPASIAELSIFGDILQKIFDQTRGRFYSKGI